MGIHDKKIEQYRNNSATHWFKHKSRHLCDIKTAALLCTFFLSGKSHAQLSPGIDWQLIRTPHFNVVAAKEALDRGQLAANMLEYLHKDLGTTLNTSLGRWTIKINHEMASSSGFVTFSPRYSEFYLPSLDMLFPSTMYDDLLIYGLATHEGRHMAQLDKSLSGFNWFWYILGGESLLMNVVWDLNGMPDWYYEGDAVLFGTEQSTSSSGRMPHFSLLTKARLTEGKPLSFYQATLGSYVKVEADDHYIQGYNLVTHLRSQYGADVMGRIVERKNSFTGQLPGGFRRSVRRVTGKSILTIYRDALDTMQSRYKKQIEDLTVTPSHHLTTPPANDYTTLFSPQWINNETIMYITQQHESVGRIEKITLSGKKTSVASRIGIMLPAFSYGDSTIVYSDLKKHPRFDNEYADIFSYDLSNKRFTRLSADARYYSPVLNESGDAIAVLSLDSTGQAGIRILDASNGEVKSAIQLSFLHVPSSPQWHNETGSVRFIVNAPEGYGIAQWNPQDSSTTMLFDFQDDKLSCLHSFDHWTFYTSQCSGIDNIYAFDTRSGERFQVTSRTYSASHPVVSPDGKQIAFIDYIGSAGQALALMPFDTTTWIRRDSVAIRPVRLYDTTTDSSPRYSLKQFAATKQDTFPVEKFPLGKRLVNVHSWQLLADPLFFVNGTDFFGLGLQSNSIFNDFGWGLRSGYDQSLDQLGLSAVVTYSGWWPHMTLGAIFRRNDLFETRNSFSSDLATPAGLSLPCFFTLNQSLLYTSVGVDVIPQVALDRSGRRIVGNDIVTTDYYSEGWLEYEAPTTNMAGYYGIGAKIRYSAVPYAQNREDHQRVLLTSLNTSLPGFRGRDNILLTASHLWCDNSASNEDYQYLLAPRGIDSIAPAGNRIAASAGYTLPLFHPDVALGLLVYFKRIGMTLFADGTVSLDGEGTNFLDRKRAWSTGIELTADIIPFTLKYIPLTVGIRGAYTKNEQKEKFPAYSLIFRSDIPGLGLSRHRAETTQAVSKGWKMPLNEHRTHHRAIR